MYKLTTQEFEMLNHYIEKKVLHYLMKKYPLTQNSEVNKKL